MSILTVVEIRPGDETMIVLQSPLRGSGDPAKYSANDTLSVKLLPPKATAATTPLGSPSVDWWKDPDPTTGVAQQTGYDQAQTVTTLHYADTIGLMPGVSYTLEVWRTIAGDPANPERIATAIVKVLPVSYPG